MAASSVSTPNARVSPFDQILEVEREQERREHDARVALEQERAAEEDALRAEADAKVEQTRQAKRQELVDYKNNHLPQILTQGEERTKQEIARIERECAPRVEAAAKAVVDHALSSTFSLSL